MLLGKVEGLRQRERWKKEGVGEVRRIGRRKKKVSWKRGGTKEEGKGTYSWVQFGKFETRLNDKKRRETKYKK